ncbi:MAG TPA: hypothetical protein VE963_10165 [Reyranella sp.]|nr:hypothetical protein [Reyranella sp.]
MLTTEKTRHWSGAPPAHHTDGTPDIVEYSKCSGVSGWTRA